MNLIGKFYIYEMEMWNEDYFNIEVPAFIELDEEHNGCFQFGFVSGSVDGRLVDGSEGSIIEFTWEGDDEGEPVFGSGWIRTEEENCIKGHFQFQAGDHSLFWARRAYAKS
ncbi:hypothetical protein [Priestia abyssalis]|uniref:hypothetical protein n=1 Tax=Priestia abyssalis TaxID=1221450 RepID=UPI001956AB4F|nr:hypothetical protein [Priestia abyssalis]